MKDLAWRIECVQAPLTIGVTGHRDLRDADLEHLERKVAQVFSRLRKQYPCTPLVVLSALAEGADRLVARIALRPEFGAKLLVPLPMPRILYALDFEAPGSLAEFDDLAAQADQCFEISPVDDPEALLQPGPARDRRYEEAGIFIVRQCQILIALWDGVDSGKIGGTSSVVRFHTEGIGGTGKDELEPPELFPVYHILTPRQSHPSPRGEPFRLKEIYPPVFHQEGPAAAYYATVFRNLDEFNRRISEGGDKLLERAARSRRKVIGNLDASKLSPDEALTLDRYSVADALAVDVQSKMVPTQLALHAAVFAWFACFVLFAHLDEHFAGWLLSFWAFLAISGYIVGRAKKIKLDNHCLDYRAVAEGCRVRFFWMLAEVPESVPDNYLGKQRTEMDWTRNGQRGWAIGPSQTSPDAFSNLRERFEFVLRHWVDQQHRYFVRSAKRDHQKLHYCELGSKWFLGAAIATSGPLFALVLFQHQDWWACANCSWVSGYVIAMDLLLALAALTHHFKERMAYSEHIKQYRRMEVVFKRAAGRIREKLAAGDAEGIRQTLRTLGKEALAENGDWVLMHRERPLELPHP